MNTILHNERNAPLSREERAAAALRENLRKRKATANADASLAPDVAARSNRNIKKED